MSRIIPILLSVFGFRAVSGTAAAWRTKCGDERGDEWDTRRGTRRGACAPWPMAAGASILAAGGYGGRSFRRNRRCDRSRDRTGGNAASSARLLPPPIASGYCSLQLNMYSAQLWWEQAGGDRHALDRNQSLRVRTRRLVRGLYLRTPRAVRASTGHDVSPARMPRESNQEGERRKNELGHPPSLRFRLRQGYGGHVGATGPPSLRFRLRQGYGGHVGAAGPPSLPFGAAGPPSVRFGVSGRDLLHVGTQRGRAGARVSGSACHVGSGPRITHCAIGSARRISDSPDTLGAIDNARRRHSRRAWHSFMGNLLFAPALQAGDRHG